MTVGGLLTLLPAVVAACPPEVAAAAAELVDERHRGATPAESIYRWLSASRYRASEHPETVLDVEDFLEVGEGDCKDFSAAAAALALAAGYRVELVATVRGDYAPHVWARVSDDGGSSWTDIDPTPGAPSFGVPVASVLPAG